MSINIRGRLMDLNRPKVMGIINVTADSFYQGSRYETTEEVLAIAGKMISEGVDIIDVGGCSTRPGSEAVPEDEEKRRVCEAIEAIRKIYPDVPVSIDTYHASVADSAVNSAGADIVNDISGGSMDDRMLPLICRLNVPYIMMHMQGTPVTMQCKPEYKDVIADILSWFSERISILHQGGVRDIILDPGFGFGKTVDHNYEMLRRLKEFGIAGLPLLVGLSRKSMIWRTLNITPDEALVGTAALNMVALMGGASVLRVHDVKEAREVVTLYEKIYP